MVQLRKIQSYKITIRYYLLIIKIKYKRTTFHLDYYFFVFLSSLVVGAKYSRDMSVLKGGYSDPVNVFYILANS